MSFFDETKNFGLMAMIAGLVMVLSAILWVVDGFDLGLIGVLIAGLLLLIFGLGVYQGESKLNIGSLFDEGVTSKFGLVVAFIIIVGVIDIVQGIFALNIMSIVVGVLLILFGFLMKMDLSPILEKIIWIILLIVFLLGIISGILSVVGAFGGEPLWIVLNVLNAVAYLVIYIMLFLYMLSPEVKSRMSM
ncbi:MAG: hypothetical protein ACOX10_01070 [Candidatus Methanomethylophilaceae archaeon]|jgi:hypothetical protein|nr:hypothetical protein AOA81_06690 [Methanomassiliicoccales archaeon RumEn M2]MDI9379121.1 hypothetical protein [Candidatus Thermoplasmatota archaeon]